MTALLQQAFKKAAALPEELQDELATEVLEELEWEMSWDQTLANSQDLLEQLTLKAMKEHKEGRTVFCHFCQSITTTSFLSTTSSSLCAVSIHVVFTKILP